MIDKNIDLYAYRVHTTGGHVHKCLVPFSDAYDFWDEIKILKESSRDLYTHYLTSQNELISLIIEAKQVVSIDSPYNKEPSMTIQEHEKRLQATRTKLLSARKQKKVVFQKPVGQSARRR